MKKYAYLFLTFISVFAANITFSQTPEFYYTTSGWATDNHFPLDHSSNRKVQWLYGPNYFVSTSSLSVKADTGLITKIYLKIGSTYSSSATYSDFTVSFAQNQGTNKTWGTTSSFTTGFTQCYYQSSITFTAAAKNSWFPITLQTPFYYDPAKSLAMEIKVSGGSGNMTVHFYGSGSERKWGGYSSSSTIGSGSGLMQLGLDIIPFQLFNASYTKGNKVKLDMLFNAGSGEKVKIWRSVNDSTFTAIDSVASSSSANISYYDSVNSSKKIRYFLSYKKNSKTYYSDTFRVYRIKPNINQQTATLTWLPFKGYSTDSIYVLRFKNSKWDTLKSLKGSDTSYTHKDTTCQQIVFKIAGKEKQGKRVTLSDSIRVKFIKSTLPATPQIHLVSVENGKIKVYTDTSKNAEIAKYELYASVNDSLFKKLADVPLKDTFLHSNSKPQKFTYEYYLKAHDYCKNISLPSDTHRAILLKGKGGNYAAHLNWYAYKGIKISKYFIEKYENSAWKTVDSVSENDTFYTEKLLPCNTNFVYRVKGSEGRNKRQTYSDSISIKTFDTVSPGKPIIKMVTVLSSKSVQITWNNSDKDVDRYIIYRKNSTSTFKAIDTVKRDSAYIDSAINDSGTSYCYAIAAMDSCAKNISKLSQEHCSILLNADTSACKRQVNLSWNKYTGWPNGVEKYYIYRSSKTQSQKLLDSVSSADNTYLDFAINALETYNYKVVAKAKTSGILSSSNSDSGRINKTEMPEMLSVSKRSTSATNGTVEIKWKSPANKFYLKKYSLFYSTNGSSFKVLKDSIALTQTSYLHNGINTENADHYYYIIAVDSCGNHSDSNGVHKTMNLKFGIGQLTHNLSWSPYMGWPKNAYYVQQFNGGKWVNTDTLFSSDTNIIRFPAPCNYDQTYRIMAVDTSGNISYSDTATGKAIDSHSPDKPVIKNLSIVNEKVIKLEFTGADSADVFAYDVRLSTNHGPHLSRRLVRASSNNNYTFYDTLKSTLNDTFSYTVSTLDSCLNTTPATDTFTSIQLNGFAANNRNYLHWNSFKGFMANEQAVLLWNGSTYDTLAKLDVNITKWTHDKISCNIPRTYKIVALSKDEILYSVSDSITLTPFDTIKPNQPEIYAATVEPTGKIKLNWHWNKSSDVKYFEVWRDAGDEKFSKIHTVVYDSSFTDSTVLTTHNSYSYYIIAVDSCDVSNRSIASPQHKVMITKAETGGCRTEVRLQWSAYIGFEKNALKYRIWRSENSVSFITIADDLSSTVTQFTDSSVDLNSQYCYRIEAINTEKNHASSSDDICIEPQVIPSPDTTKIIRTTVQQKNEILIEWQRTNIADTFARGYTIYHASNNKSFTKLADIKDLNTTAYIHSGINASSDTHSYYIVTYNVCGESSPYKSIHKPVNLHIENKNLSTKLSWSAYNGFAVKQYDVMRSEDGLPYKAISSANTNIQSLTDTNIRCGHKYSYKIFTYGFADNEVSVSDSFTLQAFDSIAPSRPKIIMVSVENTGVNGSVSIIFHGNSERNRRGYNIYRKPNGSNTFVKIATLQNTSPSAIKWIDNAVNTIVSEASYYVTALDSCGNESLPSDTHTTVFVGTFANSGNIQIDWSSYKGWKNVSKYQLMRRQPGNTWQLLTTLPGEVFTYKDSAVKCKQFYEYSIYALAGDSIFSVSNICSDTAFENELPLISSLNSVTVTKTGNGDGAVTLSWQPSTSKDAAYYHLYRQHDNSLDWIQIASKLTTNSFTDQSLNTFTKPYNYAVEVEDSCGNISVNRSEIHRSIHLKVIPQNQKVKLEWTNYQGWNVNKYIIMRDGAIIASTIGNVVSFEDTSVLCANTYHYQVIAERTDTFIQSYSNNDSTQPFDITPPAKPYLKSSTISQPNNQVQLQWEASPSFDTRIYQIWHRDGKTGYIKILDSTNSLSYSLDYNNSISVSDCFFIQAIDYCGNQSERSNPGCLIILNGEPQKGSNTLTWNPYRDWKNGVQQYNIYRNDDSTGWNLIGSVSGNTTQYKDVLHAEDEIINYCYRVQAIESASNNPGNSFSITTCLTQQPSVYVPNAFSPDDNNLNEYFAPVGWYIKDYEMIIYNRWGQIVYSGKVNQPGWNGTVNEKPAPEGVYFYQITIESYNKDKEYLNGTVNIVR